MKNNNSMLICQNNFKKLDNDIVLSFSTFEMKDFDKNKNEDSLAQKIKGDTENFIIPCADFERGAEFKKEINLDANEKNLDDVFSK